MNNRKVLIQKIMKMAFFEAGFLFSKQYLTLSTKITILILGLFKREGKQLKMVKLGEKLRKFTRKSCSKKPGNSSILVP